MQPIPFHAALNFLAQVTTAANEKATELATTGVTNDLHNLWDGAGFYKWPLALCSVMAVFIVIERLIALRPGKVLPEEIEAAFIDGNLPSRVSNESVGGRILNYYNHRHPDGEQLKAFAQLQINRMERGLYLLDTIVSAAPLIGLLGTVTGLVTVFGGVSPDTGLPNPEVFVSGVAMALTTTVMGLFVAIPALVFSNYINRRIDTLAAKLNVGVQRLITIKGLGKTEPSA